MFFPFLHEFESAMLAHLIIIVSEQSAFKVTPCPRAFKVEFLLLLPLGIIILRLTFRGGDLLPLCKVWFIDRHVVTSFDWLHYRFLCLKIFWRLSYQVLIFLGSLTECALLFINDECLLFFFFFFFNFLRLQLLFFLFFFLINKVG